MQMSGHGETLRVVRSTSACQSLDCTNELSAVLPPPLITRS
jgi:hypothetical protein